MAVYTVHQPPLKKYENVPDAERFAFVRDGFSFWAFLFGPLWMLRHRMWLVLLGYVAVVVALLFALRVAGVGGSGRGFSMFLMMLLIGMEAGTLRRFTLGRRRWTNVGVIVADDRESAERRFFDLWVQGSWVHGEAIAPSPATRQPALPAAKPAAAPDVIGLFPQPGARR